MEIKLVVVSGEGITGPFDVKLPATVGRNRDAAVVLASRMISRKHCDLFEKDGLLMVRDLGSLNGTYIGVNRVSGEAPVKPGGLLTIGPFTFRAEYAGPPAAPDDSGTIEMPDFELQDPDAAAPKGTAQTIEFEELPGEPEPTVASAAAKPSANGDDDGFSMDWLNDEEEEEPVAPKPKAAAKPAPKAAPAAPAANDDEIDFELNASASGPSEDPLADLVAESAPPAEKPKNAPAKNGPAKKAPVDPNNETTDFILPDPSDNQQPSLSGFLKDL